MDQDIKANLLMELKMIITQCTNGKMEKLTSALLRMDTWKAMADYLCREKEENMLANSLET